MIFNMVAGGDGPNYTVGDAMAGFLYAPNTPYIPSYKFCPDFINNASSYAMSNKPLAGTIIEGIFPKASYIGEQAFRSCQSLTKVVAPKVTLIKQMAFTSAIRLQFIDFPECISIEGSAFWGVGANVEYINLPKISSVASQNNNTFSKCQYINWGSTIISNFSFSSMSALISVNAPNAIELATTFKGALLLEDFNAPNLQQITYPATLESAGFISCNFPSLTQINSHCFENCYNLQEINFSQLSSAGSYAFESCANLQSVYLPQLERVWDYTFYNCSNLQNIYLSKVSYFYSSAFTGCSKLTSVDLRGVSSVPYLASTSVFYGTPISNSTYLGYFGSIYVPSSLYNTFKTSGFWSYFSSRMVSV